MALWMERRPPLSTIKPVGGRAAPLLADAGAAPFDRFCAAERAICPFFALTEGRSATSAPISVI
ncbi:hypothetical protein HMPREF0262_03566 [Clostridium sp. ATCC 29733]|nr:hypothetical protein HMPREF0262_03566 [Clostridium sp. ATCC 29733]